jgi:nucleoside-diphosphate-sugar epimerase
MGDRMMPKKTLITGATGFIGTRLCERLALVYGLPYRALVRNYTHANRIARLDAEMVRGDLADRASIRDALDGCDAVIHLAHGDDAAAPAETRNLVAECARRGVKKFVHVSSMSVHGPAPGPACAAEATAGIGRYADPYCRSKARAELIVQRAVRQGFPAAILRPTVVYGPFSGFVTSIVAAARSGSITLIDDGRWTCNAVYVDDVCDAIRAALERDEAIGRPCFVNGQPVTWREFALGFARMVSADTDVVSLSSDEIRAYWEKQRPSLQTNLRALLKLVASPELHKTLASVPAFAVGIRSAKRAVVRRLSSESLQRLKKRAARPAGASGASVGVPNPGRLIRETCRVAFSTERAREVLRWQPAHDFERGAMKTRAWLEFARFVPEAATEPALARLESVSG